MGNVLVVTCLTSQGISDEEEKWSPFKYNSNFCFRPVFQHVTTAFKILIISRPRANTYCFVSYPTSRWCCKGICHSSNKKNQADLSSIELHPLSKRMERNRFIPRELKENFQNFEKKNLLSDSETFSTDSFIPYANSVPSTVCSRNLTLRQEPLLGT